MSPENQGARPGVHPLRTLRSTVRGKAMKPQNTNSETSQRPAAMQQPDDGSRRRFLKSSMFGLALALSPSAITEAFGDSKPITIQKEEDMTQSSATQTASEQTDKTAIRPFQFNFPDAELADLRRRV